MANLAEMKLKVNNGVATLAEAEVLLHQAGHKMEEVVTLWQSVSNHPDLAAAISQLNRAADELERVIAQKSSAVVQAESYAARL